jgi:DNA invertase Pin-like site-specific DNA recombinase
MKTHYSRDVEASPDLDTELQHVLRRLNRGDILVIPSVDHLARRWSDLQTILAFLEDRGVVLAPRHTSMKPGESTEVGFKRDLKRAGAARAAARGAYRGCTGRPKKAERELARKLRAAGLETNAIADLLRVSERTVQRYMSRQDQAAA